jgi:hypothetical protein
MWKIIGLRFMWNPSSVRNYKGTVSEVPVLYVDVNQLSFSGQTVGDPFESFLRPVESFLSSPLSDCMIRFGEPLSDHKIRFGEYLSETSPNDSPMQNRK